MASWTKRELSPSDEPEAKKARVYVIPPPVPSEPTQRVMLNPADCDLDFDIEENGLQGSGLFESGFAYCWSGARANVGIRGGRYCFSCKIISAQRVDTDDIPLDQQHLCRLGISRGDDKVGNLGESLHSFGFGGTGKISNNNKFFDYGERFGVGDTILCAVDLESKPLASISFAKNGKWLGIAREFDAGPYGFGVVDTPSEERQWESAVFPHVLLKNVVVQLQFSFDDALVPFQGYKPWASALKDGKALMGPTFSDFHDCEVMMMVGLPASGKTTWAEKWVHEHPEKRYVLLGTNLTMDQMKVPGLLRKHNYGERFDRLMKHATSIFNTLLSRASRVPRNFIIDQTNVYKSARKRKLKPFADYQKIAVVVFPKPEELKFRMEKRFREMSKEVPTETVNEMLANYVLPKSKDMPGTDEYFDQVIFVEINRAESQKYLEDMKANQLKSRMSPIACESSSQSYHGTSVQYSGGSSAQVCNDSSWHYQVPSSGKHWQNSYPLQPSSTTIHGNDSSTGSFVTRDDLNHRRSYSGYDQSWRCENDTRRAAAAGFSNSYRCNSNYIASDTYYPPNHRSGSSLPAPMDYKEIGMNEPCAQTSSSYSPYGGQCVPGGCEVNLRAARVPTCLPPAPLQYGSTYGASNPRPYYESYPMMAPQSGGYAQPHVGMHAPQAGGYGLPRPGYY